MFEIEREARWRVWALFALLLSMVLRVHVGCVWSPCWRRRPLSTGQDVFRLARRVRALPGFSLSLAWARADRRASLAVALGYWFVSRIGARDHLIRVMHAQPLDPDDRFHQRLADIVEEMRIATGAPAIRCLTVPTVGHERLRLQRPARRRLHRRDRGRAVAPVTTAARGGRRPRVRPRPVGRLRHGHQRLPAVRRVHVAGRQPATTPPRRVASARAEPLLLALIVLRGCSGCCSSASAVVNAAISRQGEWAADLAAARYTRDPLSLAQALQMMVRHPGGGGYIPDGLSALCIRPTDLNSAIGGQRAPWPRTRRSTTASSRCSTSLTSSWEQFQGQAAAAEADLRAARARDPGARRGGRTPGAERLAQVRRRAAHGRRAGRRDVMSGHGVATERGAPPARRRHTALAARRRTAARPPPAAAARESSHAAGRVARCALTRRSNWPWRARSAAPRSSAATTRAPTCSSAVRVPGGSPRHRRCSAS